MDLCGVSHMGGLHVCVSAGLRYATLQDARVCDARDACVLKRVSRHDSESGFVNMENGLSMSFGLFQAVMHWPTA